MQGDLFEGCPVAAFQDEVKFDGRDDLASLLTTLRGAVGIRQVRAIVMTQACDLEQGKIRDVILCQAYGLDDYRTGWEEGWRQKNNGSPPNKDATHNNCFKYARPSIYWRA
jgi:hypothetical protein